MHASTACRARPCRHAEAPDQAPAAQAPKWEFLLDEGQQPGAGGAPLYLGSLPARPPAQCAAILGFRPKDLPAGMAGILGTGLGTREPHFTLVLGGEAALTLCSNHALFHTLLLFLQASEALLCILHAAMCVCAALCCFPLSMQQWYSMYCADSMQHVEGSRAPACAQGWRNLRNGSKAGMHGCRAERETVGRGRGGRPQPGLPEAVGGAAARGAAALAVHGALVRPVVARLHAFSSTRIAARKYYISKDIYGNALLCHFLQSTPTQACSAAFSP